MSGPGDLQQDRFLDFFEHAPLALLSCDREGRIQELNRTAATMFGLERSAARGEAFADLVHPREVAGFWAFLRQVLAGSDWVRCELRLRGQGVPRTVQLQGLAAPAADGGVGARLAAMDVTERQEAEALQHRANRALRALNAVNQAVQAAEDEATLLDRVCRFLTAEAGYALAWVGAPIHDERGSVQFLAGAGQTQYLDRVWPTITWADHDRGRGPFARAVVSGRPSIHPALESDPAFVPWRDHALALDLNSLTALPLRDDSGVMGVLGIYAHDADAFDDEEMRWLCRLADELATAWTSLRLRAETRRIERERDRLVELLDAAPDFIATADPQGNHLYHNQGARQLLGVAPGEAMTDWHVSNGHPEWAARLVLEEGFPTAREEGIWRGEVAFLDGQGREVPFAQTILAHFDDSGEVECYSTIAHDLRPIRRQRAELERHRRLMALGELGSVLAHQLNQPLAAAANYIEGSLKRLKRVEGAPDALVWGLGEGLQQVHRAGDVVRNIRRFLRGEPPQFRTVAINPLIQRLVPGLTREQGGPDFRLRMELAEDLPEVPADPILIQECLLNLVHNAAEAAPGAPDQPAPVTVRTRPSPDGVEVQVVDRGPGLPQPLRENLDQPLYTTKDSGMGLGLSICRSVVEAHGGHLWATDNPDQAGTTFHFTLPTGNGGEHDG